MSKKCKTCKQEIPFNLVNGIKTYNQKYGYGIKCGCYAKWLISDDPKAKETFDKFLIKNKRDYEKSKISPRSKKRIAQEKIYSQLRKAFLNKEENKVCPITGQRTTDLHHKKGRIGDLLIDTRYWIALSREGHIFVEQNPEWAKANGYSLSRLEK